MKPISRAEVIRGLDRRMIEEVGLPAVALMEHAGGACARLLLGHYPGARRVRVLAGPGNNGGDGYVIARHLAVAGLEVRVHAVLPPRTREAQVHAQVCENLGLLAPPDAEDWADLVIDAVLGTGQRGPLHAALPRLDFGASLVAIDVPTGIDADTGTSYGGPLARPELALVIGRRKPWMYAHPVATRFVDLGLDALATEPPEAIEHAPATAWTWPADANKWTRGHVGVRAGSVEMAGAAVLVCTGALRAGAGLVTLFLEREAWPRLGALPPEVMLQTPDALAGAAGARCDALVLGPGLGRASDAEVRHCWTNEERPCVMDADALRAIAPLHTMGKPGGPRLLTPHAGEAAALLGMARDALGDDRFAVATKLGAYAPTVLKGACSIVAGAGPLRVHSGWLPQLGTAGSGDVLAGVCGALLAREPRARTHDAVIERASLAVAMHLAAGRAVPVGATASDLAGALPA